MTPKKLFDDNMGPSEKLSEEPSEERFEKPVPNDHQGDRSWGSASWWGSSWDGWHGSKWDWGYNGHPRFQRHYSFWDYEQKVADRLWERAPTKKVFNEQDENPVPEEFPENTPEKPPVKCEPAAAEDEKAAMQPAPANKAVDNTKNNMEPKKEVDKTKDNMKPKNDEVAKTKDDNMKPLKQDQDDMWRRDKWGNLLNASALYQRFYRNIRSSFSTETLHECL